MEFALNDAFLAGLSLADGTYGDADGGGTAVSVPGERGVLPYGG